MQHVCCLINRINKLINLKNEQNIGSLIPSHTVYFTTLTVKETIIKGMFGENKVAALEQLKHGGDQYAFSGDVASSDTGSIAQVNKCDMVSQEIEAEKRLFSRASTVGQ